MVPFLPTTATLGGEFAPVLFGPVLGSALLTTLVVAILVVFVIVLVVRTAIGIAWKLLPVAIVVLVALWLFGML